MLFAVAAMLAACWLGNEYRSSTKRLNATSHLQKVGLRFRHARNDIGGFTLTGNVVIQPQPDAKPSK